MNKNNLVSAFLKNYKLKMRCIFLMLHTLIWTFSLSGQDIHYAQFMYSPLNLNPAMTGFFDGDYRFTLNHREQWNAVSIPYKTFSGSFDMNLSGLSNEKNRINAGIQFNSDKAGDSEFGTLEVIFSGGLLKRLDLEGKHFISGGIQAGIVQRSINYNKLTFDNQFNGDVYDPTISPEENFETSRFYYFNFHAGLGWHYRLNDNYKVGAGLGLQHINKPAQSFFENKSVRLPMRLQINVNAEVILTSRISFLPDMLWMKQNTFTELNGGGQVKFTLSEKPGKQYALFLGAEMRLRDAIIPMVGMDYNSIHVGVSYDVNFSGLKRASNGRGGFEFSLIYIIKKVKQEISKPPCVIY